MGGRRSEELEEMVCGREESKELEEMVAVVRVKMTKSSLPTHRQYWGKPSAESPSRD